MTDRKPGHVACIIFIDDLYKRLNERLTVNLITSRSKRQNIRDSTQKYSSVAVGMRVRAGTGRLGYIKIITTRILKSMHNTSSYKLHMQYTVATAITTAALIINGDNLASMTRRQIFRMLYTCESEYELDIISWQALNHFLATCLGLMAVASPAPELGGTCYR